MAQAQMTIASAVVLPEDDPSSPGPQKRRGSSASNPENKRRRLSATTAEPGRLHQEQPEIASTKRVTGRRVNGEAEERRRGQRLFGGLLGTLSQNSSSTTQRRRADIESKQKTKLKLQADEYDEKKRKELDDLIVLRKRQQQKFEEQSMHIRHSNLLAMAHFLHTTVEPRLYYKPWELRPEEEERVKRQIREAEETIAKELAEFNADGHLQKESSPKGHQSDPQTVAAPGKHQTPNQTATSPDPNQEAVPDAQPTNTNRHDSDPNSGHIPDTHQTSPRANGDEADGGDGGDVVVEADEDTVIY